jgi:hypothetical protein
VVGVAAEQLPDTLRFAVGQAERAVQGLFCQLRQVVQCNRRRGGISRAASTLRLTR